MYRGYSGFLPQEAAIEEQNNIRIKIQEYKQAKKIDEYLKMLIDDSIGEAEVKYLLEKRFNIEKIALRRL